MGRSEMTEDYLNKVVVDVESRCGRIYSDEGESNTIDCSDDYEAFLRVVELCRNEASDETVYAPLSDS